MILVSRGLSGWAKRLLCAGLALAVLPAGAVIPTPPRQNPEAAARIAKFLDICSHTVDLEQAARAVVAAGLVHASKLNPQDATILNADAMRFSFKKACGNAHFYEAKITRIVPNPITGVGHGATAEKGVVHRYFVGKKISAGGVAAPIHVFFPASGAPPVLFDWGSL